MKKPNAANVSSFENKFFVLLLLVVSLGFLWVLSPFYGAVFWGAVFAIVFAPLHARLLRVMPTRRTLTATLALLFILLLVIFPLGLLSALLVQESGVVFQRLQTGELNFSLYFQQIYEALPGWVTGLLGRFGLTDMALVQERIAVSLTQGSQFFA
ncbi:MAG: AI-2E family transporter, partial [Polaromonas sp.]|nr:AI-2E family transporter [Polaromonas sp.]